MSNLKLPDMSYSNLMKLTAATGDKWRKVAYETYVKRQDNDVLVKHHSSVIARVSESHTILDNNGYVSSTTTGRMHAIATANTDYKVAIRNRSQALLDWDCKIQKDISWSIPVTLMNK